MRYELQKTFDINLRLSDWASKENTFAGVPITIIKLSWENEKKAVKRIF
jgi:hypothetical protein